MARSYSGVEVQRVSLAGGVGVVHGRDQKYASFLP
jgi:hypothetical protein